MTEQERINDTQAPLKEHLRELRIRLLYSIGFILVGFGIAWGFHQQLFDWLMEPYTNSMLSRFPDEERYINYRSLAEPFIVYIKTAGLVGVLLTIPFVLHQIWIFVAPALFKKERIMAIPFLIASVFFFVGGATFCRYIVLDPAISVLLSIGSTSTNPTIMMSEYFSFISKMLLVFGALFELPVVITFLSLLRLVKAKWLLKQWRYVIVLAFLIGAMMTPPDPLTQIALAVPLVILYALSIVIAFFIEKMQGKKLPDQSDPESDP